MAHTFHVVRCQGLTLYPLTPFPPAGADPLASLPIESPLNLADWDSEEAQELRLLWPENSGFCPSNPVAPRDNPD